MNLHFDRGSPVHCCNVDPIHCSWSCRHHTCLNCNWRLTSSWSGSGRWHLGESWMQNQYGRSWERKRIFRRFRGRHILYRYRYIIKKIHFFNEFCTCTIIEDPNYSQLDWKKSRTYSMNGSQLQSARSKKNKARHLFNSRPLTIHRCRFGGCKCTLRIDFRLLKQDSRSGCFSSCRIL